MMSISNNPDLPDPNISLQKPNNIPPDLPSVDKYGNPLPQLLSEPRSCRAGWGLSWLTKAFIMFKDQFLLWLGIGVVYLVILMIGSFIPVINFIFPFITFVFIGGIILGCDAQATGRELRFDHLFSASNTHLLPLIILFLLYLVAVIIAIIPMAIVFGVMTMIAPLLGSTAKQWCYHRNIVRHFASTATLNSCVDGHLVCTSSDCSS